MAKELFDVDQKSISSHSIPKNTIKDIVHNIIIYINKNDSTGLDQYIDQLEDKKSKNPQNIDIQLELIKKIFDWGKYIQDVNGNIDNNVNHILLLKASLKLINQAFKYGKDKIQYGGDNLSSLCYLSQLSYYIFNKQGQANERHVDSITLIQLINDDNSIQNSFKNIFNIAISNMVDNYNSANMDNENNYNIATYLMNIILHSVLSDDLIKLFSNKYDALVKKLNNQNNVLDAQKKLLTTSFGTCFRIFYRQYLIRFDSNENKAKNLAHLLRDKLLFIRDPIKYDYYAKQEKEKQDFEWEVNMPLERFYTVMADHDLYDQGIEIMEYNYNVYKDLDFANQILRNIAILYNAKAIHLRDIGDKSSLNCFRRAIEYLNQIKQEFFHNRNCIYQLGYIIIGSGFHEEIVTNAKQLLDKFIKLYPNGNKHYQLLLQLITMEGLNSSDQLKELNKIQIQEVIGLDNGTVKLLYLRYCKRLKQYDKIIEVFENQQYNHYFNGAEDINFIGIRGLLKSQKGTKKLFEIINESIKANNYSMYMQPSRLRFYAMINLYFLINESLPQQYQELSKMVNDLLKDQVVDNDKALKNYLSGNYREARVVSNSLYEEMIRGLKGSGYSEITKKERLHNLNQQLLFNIIFLDMVVLFEDLFIKPKDRSIDQIIQFKDQILKDLNGIYQMLLDNEVISTYFNPLRLLIEELSDNKSLVSDNNNSAILSDNDFVIKLFNGLSYYMRNPRYYYIMIKLDPPLKGFIEKIQEIEKSLVLLTGKEEDSETLPVYFPSSTSEIEIQKVIKIADPQDHKSPFGMKYPIDKLIHIQNTKIYCYFDWDKIKIPDLTLEKKFKAAAEKGEIVRAKGQSGFKIFTCGKKHTIDLKILGKGGDYRILPTTKIKTDSSGHLLYIFESESQKIHDGKQFTIRI